jgi:hypothetical protein
MMRKTVFAAASCWLVALLVASPLAFAQGAAADYSFPAIEKRIKESTATARDLSELSGIV